MANKVININKWFKILNNMANKDRKLDKSKINC